jgi:predicted dehydrogenase
MIAAGEFGRISHIVYRGIRPTMRRYVEWDSPWMAEKSKAGGGTLLNLGGHGFDIAQFVTGEEPEVISTVLSRQVHGAEVEDYALTTMRTPSGILIHNEVGRLYGAAGVLEEQQPGAPQVDGHVEGLALQRALGFSLR